VVEVENMNKINETASTSSYSIEDKRPDLKSFKSIMTHNEAPPKKTPSDSQYPLSIVYPPPHSLHSKSNNMLNTLWIWSQLVRWL